MKSVLYNSNGQGKSNFVTLIPLPPSPSTLQRHPGVSLQGSSHLCGSSSLAITVNGREVKLTNLSTGRGICSVGFGTTCEGVRVMGECVVFVEEGGSLHCLSLNPLNSIWTAEMEQGSAWDASEGYAVAEVMGSIETTGFFRVLDVKDGGKMMNSRKVHSRKVACCRIHSPSPTSTPVLISAGLPCNSVKVTSLPGLDPLRVLYRGATMKHVTHLCGYGNLVA
eukprot:CAMPEP_0118633746 /NCGR_PEP_ID=MMETSP0785-20121206/1165_1 /TAXON_ID=91992 /ORGANISM="Bolidomonas pacifica, Strain CCMP 1866" /LENGTH=222 /DNA_ID=CAMNT_0006524649 /DNA_START=99 /DNA_END=764 /DNA_ORIENTATION=-